jgi:hypothetical protein
MSVFLLAASLAAAPVEVETFSSVDAAAAALATEVQTGALLFSKGDCLAIRVYTNSPYTHVACVVVQDGTPFVYDSQNGAGVRRLTLDEYLRAEQPDRLHIYQPREPFSPARAEKLVAHLDEQLGRPYDVMHHVTGNRAEGLHCSEYTTDALIACDVLRAKQPSRVSPASLREGIVKGNLYTAGSTVEINVPVDVAEGDNWCEQLWIDTKVCTVRCCRKMQGWFLCR